MPVKLWQGWSSVQTRITGLMVVAGIFAVLLLVAFGTNETHRMDAYMATDAKEDGQLLDRTLELAGASLATFTRDYSMWGEMVEFVQTGDRTWANVNIDVGIVTYQANAAWVFDPSGSPVYAVRDSTLEALLDPLPAGLSVTDVFGDSQFCYFFIAGPDGPVEIRGSTIHPSEDDERKTPVRGYFLAARAWNGQYLAELSRLTGKTMQIEPARDRTKPSTRIVRQSGEITFIRPLPGPQGKPELILTALYRPEWIQVVRRSSSGLSAQMATLALLAVLGLTLVLWLWVTRPLGRIARSLESGTTEALKPFEHNHTEFGQLAKLIGRYFGQNAALVKEVTERKQAEAELVKHRENLKELVAERTRALTAAQEQLVLQEKLATVGRVAGSVAHELRNPLGAIRNASFYLQMTAAPKLEGKQLRHLQVIDEYVDRANKAISMILDFTQGRQSEPVPCALQPILQRAVTDAGLPPNVEVLIAIPPRLPQVLVDDGQIVVVFRNLLTNAGRAMPGGGTVKIQARAGQDGVVVDVVDTGTGVKPEHMASLFKPLFTTGEIGIGLGLSICRGFVRSNKGTISVVSELGKGTTFTVTLPTAEANLAIGRDF